MNNVVLAIEGVLFLVLIIALTLFNTLLVILPDCTTTCCCYCYVTLIAPFSPPAALALTTTLVEPLTLASVAVAATRCWLIGIEISLLTVPVLQPLIPSAAVDVSAAIGVTASVDVTVLVAVIAGEAKLEGDSSMLNALGILKLFSTLLGLRCILLLVLTTVAFNILGTCTPAAAAATAATDAKWWLNCWKCWLNSGECACGW